MPRSQPMRCSLRVRPPSRSITAAAANPAQRQTRRWEHTPSRNSALPASNSPRAMLVFTVMVFPAADQRTAAPLNHAASMNPPISTANAPAAPTAQWMAPRLPRSPPRCVAACACVACMLPFRSVLLIAQRGRGSDQGPTIRAPADITSRHAAIALTPAASLPPRIAPSHRRSSQSKTPAVQAAHATSLPPPQAN